MSTLAVLALAGLITWVLRVSFITLVPADRLPACVARALDQVGPSVMAALVAGYVINASGGLTAAVAPSRHLLATAVTAAVAWRRHNLVVTVVGGIAAYWLIGALAG